MPHDEERIPGDRLAEQMETRFKMQDGPNIGWKCNAVPGCDFESRRMPGAADDVLYHIKVDHPELWTDGNWSMLPIRRKDNVQQIQN